MMEEGESVVVSMGRAEATVLGMALGLFLTKINYDLKNESMGVYDMEMSSLMESFQMKITAEEMFSSLWSVLGVDDEQIESMIEGTEKDI